MKKINVKEKVVDQKSTKNLANILYLMVLRYFAHNIYGKKGSVFEETVLKMTYNELL